MKPTIEILKEANSEKINKNNSSEINNVNIHNNTNEMENPFSSNNSTEFDRSNIIINHEMDDINDVLPISKNSALPEIFSFKEMESMYKDYKGSCRKDSDCPDDMVCLANDICVLLFSCNENDLTRCANTHISNKYISSCKTDDDCLSNSCINFECSGRTVKASVGTGKAKYGLSVGEKCSQDSDCYEQNCNNGVCSMYSLGGNDTQVRVLGIIGAVAGVILVIFLCACCCYRKKNSKGERV
ncbi:hypothetical protein PIROE2DRAFT_61029 [Piromyces sp. E2]|nr:hypothetical protein PIROE2DRAFT_61029 [Piromyces sp. E2]|eukprot:OUM63845.1 hypothetical protein PIROE2DRAFT_61029 [Piromyces sp. E2]